MPRTHPTNVDDRNRFWELIEARIKNPARRSEVDQEIWRRFGGRWAVLFTDLSGFSRSVAEHGIVHFLEILLKQQNLFAPIIERHRCETVKQEGDSLAIVTPDADAAIDLAIDLQHACGSHNASCDPAQAMVLSVGIGYGDILRIGTDELFGHEVNLASKLGEDLAGPDEILLTQAAYSAARTHCEKRRCQSTELVGAGTIRSYRLVYPAGRYKEPIPAAD